MKYQEGSWIWAFSTKEGPDPGMPDPEAMFGTGTKENNKVFRICIPKNFTAKILIPLS